MHQVVRTLVQEHRLRHAQIAHHHAATLVRQLVPQLVKVHQVVAAENAHRLVLLDVAHHVEVVALHHVVLNVHQVVVPRAEAVAQVDVKIHVRLHAEIIVQVLV